MGEKLLIGENEVGRVCAVGGFCGGVFDVQRKEKSGSENLWKGIQVPTLWVKIIMNVLGRLLISK